MLYIPLIRVVVGNVKELEASATGSSGSPELSPLTTVGQQVRTKSQTIAATQPATTTIAPIKHTSATLPSGLNGRNYAWQAQTLPHPTISALAEKLDKEEMKDLLLCVCYLLNKLPKRMLGALWCAQETININDTTIIGEAEERTEVPSANAYLNFIRLLELTLHVFRYKGRLHHEREKETIRQRNARMNANFLTTRSALTIESQFTNSGTLTEPTHIATQNALNVVEEETGCSTIDGQTSSASFLLDCNLTQEVALVVLDTVQTLANQLAVSWAGCDVTASPTVCVKNSSHISRI